MSYRDIDLVYGISCDYEELMSIVSEYDPDLSGFKDLEVNILPRIRDDFAEEEWNEMENSEKMGYRQEWANDILDDLNLEDKFNTELSLDTEEGSIYKTFNVFRFPLYGPLDHRPFAVFGVLVERLHFEHDFQSSDLNITRETLGEIQELMIHHKLARSPKDLKMFSIHNICY